MQSSNEKNIQNKKYLVFLLIFAIIISLGIYKVNSLKYYYSVLAMRFENLDKKPQVLIEEVPFVSQVGYEDDELSNLGCEEAALVMVESYFTGKNPGKIEKKKEMQKLIQYQKENYKGHNQLGAEKLRKLSKDIYGIDGIILKENFLKEINRALDEKKPVITPSLAKYLKNPLYSEKGYHMLVIVGYNGSGYFAHDSGTQNGAYFFYPKETILEAMFDIETKDKKILILGDINE